MSAPRPEPNDRRLLLRRLHGELEPGALGVLEARLAREPGLAAADRDLRALWDALGSPPEAPVPAGFRAEVLARVRQAAAGDLRWSQAPAWARAAAAVALAAGLALGVGVGRMVTTTSAPPSAARVETAGTVETVDAVSDAWADDEAWTSEPISLAEAYWESLEEDGQESGT